VYLDDIVLASHSVEEHVVHLRQLFERLQQFGLVINGEKCIFGQSSVEFLGHQVSAKGALPLQGNVKAILDFPQPQSVKQLQGFLGSVNFYPRFLPGAARFLKPLTDSLKGEPKPTALVQWSPEMVEAFKTAKTAVATATYLVHPSPGAEICLMVDTSADHLGAALQQRSSPSAGWQPLGFFSKKLDAAQVKYSAFDRELWACVAGIRHFRFLLEGRRFSVLTDHKPLTYALGRTSEPWTARQARHLSYIAEFTGDIRHMPGIDNIVADTLSRPASAAPVAADKGSTEVKAPPGSSVSPASAGPSMVASVPASDAVLDYRMIAAHQSTCADTVKTLSSSSLKVQPVMFGHVSVLCDISRGAARPVIPTQDRKTVFLALHSLAHPGTRATRRMLSSRVVWRGMASDIAAWCRDCQDLLLSQGDNSAQCSHPANTSAHSKIQSRSCRHCRPPSNSGRWFSVHSHRY
jgi:hypothetical protein